MEHAELDGQQESGQRCPEAGVHALSEPEVRCRPVSVQVDLVRRGESFGVAGGGGVGEEDLLAGAQGHAAELGVLGDQAAHARDGGLVSEELLEGGASAAVIPLHLGVQVRTRE